MSFKSYWYKHVAPYINFFLNWLLNFILAFEVLMLRLKNHLTSHFYFEYAKRMLNVYSNLLYAHSKYFGNNISMNPLFVCPIWRIFFVALHCKKSFAKFRCGQRWREPNDVGVGKYPLPRRLVPRHRCQHRSLAHSDMAFFYSVETSWRR